MEHACALLFSTQCYQPVFLVPHTKIIMKGAIVACLCALAAVTMARPEDGTTYTDKYDGVNVPEILNNDRLRKGYIGCTLGKAKCTAEGTELKSHMSEALQTDCAKCTPTQRQRTKEVIEYLINHDLEAWTELKEKYDPKGIYAKKYEDDLKAAKH